MDIYIYEQEYIYEQQYDTWACLTMGYVQFVLFLMGAMIMNCVILRHILNKPNCKF